MSNPSIPPRTSSLSPSKRRVLDLEAKHKMLTDKIDTMRENAHNRKSPADHKAWNLKRKLSLVELERCETMREITDQKRPRRELSDEEEEAHESALAEHDAFIENKRREIELLDRQISRLESMETPSIEAMRQITKWATECYWQTELGGRLRSTIKRNSGDQKRMRQALIDGSDAVRGPKDLVLWCPIEGAYVDDDTVKAAHIFPHLGGPAGMHAIFGIEDEMFSTRNSMLMSKKMEMAFDKCRVCLVPDTDLDSDEAVSQWIQSNARSWRMMLIGMPDEDKALRPAQGCKTFAELDGQKLQFRTALQPRARYLYWHYITAMSKYEQYNPTGEQSVKSFFKRTGRKAWVTMGQWMGKGMLKALATEMGEDFMTTLAPKANQDSGIDTGAPAETLEYTTRARIYQGAQTELTGEPEPEVVERDPRAGTDDEEDDEDDQDD